MSHPEVAPGVQRTVAVMRDNEGLIACSRRNAAFPRILGFDLALLRWRPTLRGGARKLNRVLTAARRQERLRSYCGSTPSGILHRSTDM